MKTIILHGWGHNNSLWESLATKLGDAKAIDLPGFGNEQLVDNNWGVPEYADWVLSKIKKEKGVILIGHSFGGRVAVELASRKDNNIKGLVLSGAPCVYRPTSKTQAKIKIYKTSKKLLPLKLREKFYSQDLKDSQNQGLENIFRKVVIYDQTKQLEKIDIFTLLLWGENDTQVPLKIAQKMKMLIKNSELKIIENTGHNCFIEKPDLFFGYVKNYISNL